MQSTERVYCRLCNYILSDPFLDLGLQCLQGQFPATREEALAMPKYPLRLAYCQHCKLVQLKDSLPPQDMFKEYWYRSGITETMREHLRGLALSAADRKRLSHEIKVLDIGSNDGTLLSYLPGERYGIDPCNVPVKFEIKKWQGMFPDDLPSGWKFDLVFSVAMFYDVNSPIKFAKSIRGVLEEDGHWCIEVAYLPDMLRNLSWDGICFEHQCYYSLETLMRVARQSGLEIEDVSFSKCNGGSVRVWMKPGSSPWLYEQDNPTEDDLLDFADKVEEHAALLKWDVSEVQGPIHLLGASTKGNTLLQYCNFDHAKIEAASDRDVRKHGRFTPGTGIPIISEEESRERNPAAYLCLIPAFKEEVLRREQDYLKQGGRIIFPWSRT